MASESQCRSRGPPGKGERVAQQDPCAQEERTRDEPRSAPAAAMEMPRAYASPVPRPASTPAAKPAAASSGGEPHPKFVAQSAMSSSRNSGRSVQASPAFSSAGSLLNFVLPFAGADSPQDAEGGLDSLTPNEAGRPFSTGLYVARKSPYMVQPAPPARRQKRVGNRHGH